MRFGVPMPVKNERAQIMIDASASGTLEVSPSARIVTKPAPNRIAVILAFGAIWFIWGSTFLAIRYAVETIPPLYAAGTRHLIAGSLMISWCFHQEVTADESAAARQLHRRVFLFRRWPRFGSLGPTMGAIRHCSPSHCHGTHLGFSTCRHR